MSSESRSNRVRRNNFPLRGSASVDSLLPGAEEELVEVLQEVTFRARRNLTDQDWYGESIRVRQERMVDAFGDFGINLRRHHSFGSDDSLFVADMNSPRVLRDAVTTEIERMRRNFERQHGDDDRGEKMGAVGGIAHEQSTERTTRRLEQLPRELDDFATRHNRILDQFIPLVDQSEGLHATINRCNEEISEAQAAEQAAERDRERDRAGRGLDHGWMRNRDRRNFGEDDYDIGVTLKLIKLGFLRNCKLVFSRSRARDHPFVLELILNNKLTDRAMRDMKSKDIETMEQLEAELECLYEPKKSIASLQSELSKLKQREGESVSSTGSGAETITAELVDELSKNKEQAEKRIVQETVRECAKASSENGLHGPLQVLVRDFKTLNDSVLRAIDLAKTSNFRLEKSQNYVEKAMERTCYGCNLAGHILLSYSTGRGEAESTASRCAKADERRDNPRTAALGRSETANQCVSNWLIKFLLFTKICLFKGEECYAPDLVNCVILNMWTFNSVSVPLASITGVC